jgi:NADH-quinone oxidoreductase subunit H
MISKTFLYEGTCEYIFCAEVKDKVSNITFFSSPVIKSIIPMINFIIFPGLIFSTFFAFIISFIDRKLTARIQWRQGPPLWQAMYDFIKLLGKEVLIPSNSKKIIFILSPLISFSVIILLSTILWMYNLGFYTGFSGDIIVILYLLMIPSVMYMLGASASGNVVAGLGVSREMKLMLSYELPLITSVLVTIIKVSSIKISDIITFSYQKPIIFSVSGFIAFIVMIICFQAKTGLVPFDMSESEQELAGGVLTEYSGILLGMIKLAKQILYSVVPLFFIIIYFPGGGLILWLVKYLFVLILFILIKNTNPRLKIHQSITFFWKIVFPTSLVALLLAILGK